MYTSKMYHSSMSVIRSNNEKLKEQIRVLREAREAKERKSKEVAEVPSKPVKKEKRSIPGTYGDNLSRPTDTK